LGHGSKKHRAESLPPIEILAGIRAIFYPEVSLDHFENILYILINNRALPQEGID
jgi:hypothetical protein